MTTLAGERKRIADWFRIRARMSSGVIQVPFPVVGADGEPRYGHVEDLASRIESGDLADNVLTAGAAAQSCLRCTAMHRRAQRLEGIEARIERLRESHAHQVAKLAEHHRDCRAEWMRRNRSLGRSLSEVRNDLPPPVRIASRLDEIADIIDSYGGLTSATHGAINGSLIADRVRDGAATIRRLTADTGLRALLRAIVAWLRKETSDASN